MDEKKFGMLDEKQQKKYLFKENVRLNELKQELEADRELIDIQKGMLHSQQRKNELMKKQLESQSQDTEDTTSAALVRGMILRLIIHHIMVRTTGNMYYTTGN